MKTLNKQVKDYTSQLQQGNIQVAYKGILEYMSKLRSDFIRNYSEYEISSIYQGYMDMSFFSLNTKLLKDRGLKIIIVYMHKKMVFEVWLSGRNKKILNEYRHLLNDSYFDGITVFHDKSNKDAIMECTLTDTPDFDNQNLLTSTIQKGTNEFIDYLNQIILKDKNENSNINNISV